MYLVRKSGFIEYGFGNKIRSIPMLSNNDFVLFYSRLMSQFEENINCVYQNNSFKAFIGDNIIMNIYSDNIDDINWINDSINNNEKPFRK